LGAYLAVGDVLRDSSSYGGAVIIAPDAFGEVAALIADTRLVDLEPIPGAVIGLNIITRGTRHIDKGRT
jgi:hypothetical protein